MFLQALHSRTVSPDENMSQNSFPLSLLLTQRSQHGVMPYANNKMTLADGRITLYQRDDVKNPVWQCRITMKTVRGYIKRSTGETDITRATMAAIKLLGELEHRSANDQPLSAKKFKDVAAAYLRDAQTRWKEGRNSEGRAGSENLNRWDKWIFRATAA